MAERTELGVLNHLLEICRDGEHGFQAAADHVADPVLKDLFTVLAAQRAQFASELEPHLHRLGGQGLTDGSPAGALHRRWMNVKGAVSRHNDAAVLGEAERGERAAMHAYEEALHGIVPPTAVDLLERQAAAVHNAYTRLLALEHAREPQH